MDLGIAGRRALVTAASQGLGRAMATALARERVDITIVARRSDLLEETAAAIRAETGVTVTPVAADITTEAGRAAALAASPEPDILVNSSGGHPPGDFRNFDRAEFASAVNALMLAPIELIRATLDGMISRRFGRILNITTMGMRVPSPLHPVSNGARGGLTAFVSTIAGEQAAHNVTINNLLPGPFDTDRMKVMAAFSAQAAGHSYEDEIALRVKDNPAHRYGRPEEMGALCAFLCSDWAGYITGQSILIDGGAARTTF